MPRDSVNWMPKASRTSTGPLDLVVRTLHVQRLGKVFLGLGRQDPRAVLNAF